MPTTVYREEDEYKVVLSYRAENDADISRLTIYKTVPVSYKFEPSALQASKVVAASWEDMLSNYENTNDIVLVEGVLT